MLMVYWEINRTGYHLRYSSQWNCTLLLDGEIICLWSAACIVGKVKVPLYVTVIPPEPRRNLEPAPNG